MLGAFACSKSFVSELCIHIRNNGRPIRVSFCEAPWGLVYRWLGRPIRSRPIPESLYLLGHDIVYQETQVDLTLIRSNIETCHLQLGLELRHGFIILGLRNKNYLRAVTSNCPSTNTKRFKITPATETK